MGETPGLEVVEKSRTMYDMETGLVKFRFFP